MNYSKKLREVEAVPIAEAPEMEHLFWTRTLAKGNIEVGGLLLCRMPEGMASQRNEYYQRQSTEAITSVDNQLMRDQPTDAD